jgi:phage baseplate assembly protein W
MAIRDITKNPFIEDRNSNIFIGIDYPFRKSDGVEGYFTSTSTTIKAVKNNIKMLLNTHKGERLMQPNLGAGLRRFLFEQFTEDTVIAVQNEIIDTLKRWLPFVEIKEIDVSMDELSAIGKNKMTISILFNIIRDPNTLESVEIDIGESSAL